MLQPFVITQSGRRFTFNAPDLCDVDIKDIAAHLCKICRFAGATSTHYSVAQHSVLVADIVYTRTRRADAALAALMHDAHEAYIGDVPGPLRRAFLPAVERIADDVQAVIHQQLGLLWPVPAEDAQIIDIADCIALASEARDLLPETAFQHFDQSHGLWRKAIKPAPWPKAEVMFLERYRQLRSLAGADLAIGAH